MTAPTEVPSAVSDPAQNGKERPATRAVDGASFALDAPTEIPSNWGKEQQNAWATGEGLLLVGPDGVGKTAIQQQLLRCRIGLDNELLGLPVAPAVGKVLYIAADRPQQAARSFRRMVSEDDREILEQRLIVWRGPLPFDIGATPAALAKFTAELDATDLFVDSLKDIALDLTKDEAGSRVSRAFQEVTAAGIEFCANHHQRKEAGAGAKIAKPTRLADVYGSRWLTAGMGSVILLWGEPGDLVVDLAHLKQPAEDIGPLRILHDHVRGQTSIYHGVDLVQLIDAVYGGLTATDAAKALNETDKPKPNQIEKARRRLESLVAQGSAYRDDLNGQAHYLTRRG